MQIGRIIDYGLLFIIGLSNNIIDFKSKKLYFQKNYQEITRECDMINLAIIGGIK